MKVKLREGLKRWHYQGFFIVIGQVKECNDETFMAAGNTLEVVPEKKIVKRYSKKEKKDITPILGNIYEIDNKGEDDE